MDDEGDWREVLAQVLRQYGADVVTAGSTPDALTALERKTGARAQLILADIGLPGEDGYELIRRVRDRFSGSERIPAIAVTAYAAPDNMRRALQAGFDLFRPKPIAPEAVIAAALDALQITSEPADDRPRPPARVTVRRTRGRRAHRDTRA